MVIQNAGRGGEDHREKFVTDGEGYMSMIRHITSLLPSDLVGPTNIVGIDDSIDELTNFYSQSLNGPFERYRY
jgi:hypothetical protein